MAAEELSRDVGAAATRFTVPVAAPSGCQWTATTSAEFLTIYGGASGTGSGALEISVAENTGGERSGAVKVGAVTVSVKQSAAPLSEPAPALPCTYNVSPLSLPVTADGGTFVVHVEIAKGAGCQWTVETGDSYVNIDGPSSRTASDDVRITVARNTGASRTASLSIAGHTVSIVQDAAPAIPPAPGPQPGVCSFTVSPLSIPVPAAGGEVSVDVKSPVAGCTWSAIPTTPFVSTRGPLNRTGDGTAVIVVEKNTGPARTGTATVAGHTVSLLQEAVAPTTCVYSVSPKNTLLPASGGTVTFTVTVTQGTNCAWTAWTNSDQTVIVSGQQGVGNGTVVVSVGANPGTRRWGAVHIAGETALIEQPEAPGNCVFTVSPPSFSISAAAQTVEFDVIITTGSPSYCQFSVTQWRDDPMLSTKSLTPVGNSTRVVLGVTANTSAAPRTSSVTIAGMLNPLYVSVTQAGRSPAP